MIKTSYHEGQNRINLKYEGAVDRHQADELCRDFETRLPKYPKGFKLLVDLSALESVGQDVLPVIRKLMKLCNRYGVSEVVRIIPSPDKDFGFSILSVFHYNKDVKVLTCQSLDQVQW